LVSSKFKVEAVGGKLLQTDRTSREGPEDLISKRSVPIKMTTARYATGLSTGDAVFQHDLQEIRRTEEKWKLCKCEDFEKEKVMVDSVEDEVGRWVDQRGSGRAGRDGVEVEQMCDDPGI
jgi:hypothetical protein